MFIDIMVATMAADPAVALEPRDHLVPIGLQLRHGHRFMRKYLRIQRLPSSRMRHLLSNIVGSLYLCGLSFPDFRSRTPGPPPFSSISRPANQGVVRA
jgi:hypothetical protein